MIDRSSFNQELFTRIYQDLLQIKIELENAPKNDEQHDWIDIDHILSNNHQMKPTENK